MRAKPHPVGRADFQKQLTRTREEARRELVDEAAAIDARVGAWLAKILGVGTPNEPPKPNDTSAAK